MLAIAHYVICPYCSKSFDRDTEEYVKINSRRYAHASCALREKAKNPKLKDLVVINPLDEVVCIYCNQPFNKHDTPFTLVSKGRYAHNYCAALERDREKTDEEILNEYILELFELEFISPRIQRQINNFINDYNFTHSGILKSLQYFYEVKHNDISKANDGIGIVPWIYKDAYNYYRRLWEIDQKNQGKDITAYKPQIEEVHILAPQREGMKPKRFSFLDKDEVNEDAI